MLKTDIFVQKSFAVAGPSSTSPGTKNQDENFDIDFCRHLITLFTLF